MALCFSPAMGFVRLDVVCSVSETTSFGMSLADDLRTEVNRIFRETWTTREGQVVPEAEDLKLSNDAVKLDGTVLYADLSASTDLVDSYKDHFAAEIYRAYLYCAARIIRAEGGVITAYDGDRIMAVYIDERRNSSAARTGLKVNWVVRNIVNPALKNQYPNANYMVKQIIGIDASSLFVARTGIRGSNDLVWVGRAANYAAKLTTLSPEYPTVLTKCVFERLSDPVKTTNGRSMWEQAYWTGMGNMEIYRSTWWWSLD